MWTKEKVEDILKRNPYFENLFVEGIGKYACMYVVNGIDFIIYNNIHGEAAYFFLNRPQDNAIKQDLQSFVQLAIEVCKEVYSKKGGKR